MLVGLRKCPPQKGLNCDFPLKDKKNALLLYIWCFKILFQDNALARFFFLNSFAIQINSQIKQDELCDKLRNSFATGGLFLEFLSSRLEFIASFIFLLHTDSVSITA